ncbi:hypothetical protein Tco_1094128 [Tanacetum coccineum]|uniref:Uncharacterized protein n=1 Tax=Tanacetum coccineum TaxID=301880 RepID=A0ABQ5IFX3_9ASTR
MVLSISSTLCSFSLDFARFTVHDKLGGAHLIDCEEGGRGGEEGPEKPESKDLLAVRFSARELARFSAPLVSNNFEVKFLEEEKPSINLAWHPFLQEILKGGMDHSRMDIMLGHPIISAMTKERVGPSSRSMKSLSPNELGDLPEVGRVQYFVNKKGALGPLSPRVLVSLLKSRNGSPRYATPLRYDTLKSSLGQHCHLIVHSMVLYRTGFLTLVLEVILHVSHDSIISLDVVVKIVLGAGAGAGAEAWFILSKSNAPEQYPILKFSATSDEQLGWKDLPEMGISIRRGSITTAVLSGGNRRSLALRD